MHAQPGGKRGGEAVLEALRDKPYLGLCLGLQMRSSMARRAIPAVGRAAGNVPRFELSGLKILTWRNEVLQQGAHASGRISDKSRFYFVHSYYPAPSDRALAAATCVYGVPLPAPWPGIIFCGTVPP